MVQQDGSTVFVRFEWPSMTVDEMKDRATDMFDSASSLQQRALALPDSDARKARLVKEAHTISSAACRLQARLARPESQGNAAGHSANSESALLSTHRRRHRQQHPLQQPPRTDIFGIQAYTRLPSLPSSNNVSHPNEKVYKTSATDYKAFVQKKANQRPVRVTTQLHSLQ